MNKQTKNDFSVSCNKALSARVISVVLLCFFAAGCTARAALSVNPDKSALIEFKTQAGNTLEQTLLAFTDGSQSSIRFDEKVLRSSFEAAGMNVTELTFSGKTDIALKAHIADIRTAGAKGTVKIEKTGQEESLTLTFTPETVNALVRLLPQETAEYTELLAAPLFTGEQMEASEYAELIGTMYGKSLQADLKNAFFIFDIGAPSPISAASIEPPQTGTVRINGKTAAFRLSLNAFLSDSDKTVIRVQWKNR